MSKSILLIGGSGFLGSALRRVFREDDRYEVFFSSTHDDVSDPHHRTIDIFRPDDLRQVLDFDIIVNLTGQFVQPLSRCFALNTSGMWNLIEAIRDGSQTLIQISTTLVYGTVEKATEDLPLDPEFPYAAGKAAAEFLLKKSLPERRYLVARLSNLYGAGQTKGLLWYLVDRIRSKRDIVITDNDGFLRRHFLHVDDAAQLLHDVIARCATGTVNVPGPEAYTIRELVALSERILGRPLFATYATTPPRGNIDVISAEKLQSLVPVHYHHSVEEYLRENLVP